MFKKIKPEETNFFDSDNFRPYRVKFNILYQDLTIAEQIFINDTSTAAVIFPKKRTTLIWIDETLPPREAERLIEELTAYIFDEGAKITELRIANKYSDSFARNYKKISGCSYKKIHGEIAYFCDRLIPPPYHGELVPVSEEHLDVVAGFIKNFEQECFDETVDEKENLEKTSRFIKTRLGFLWKDGGDFTALGFISHKSKAQGRINYIYVPKEFRGRNYAKMITAGMVGLILKEGLRPVLYAIEGNEASNGAYQRIGFEAGGQMDMIEFHF